LGVDDDADAVDIADDDCDGAGSGREAADDIEDDSLGLSLPRNCDGAVDSDSMVRFVSVDLLVSLQESVRSKWLDWDAEVGVAITNHN
jgi:hypothetical protein